MPKTNEEIKVVQTYEQEYPGGKVVAQVTSFKKKGTEIYIDIKDGDGLPFGTLNNVTRDKASALLNMLMDILQEHPA